MAKKKKRDLFPTSSKNTYSKTLRKAVSNTFQKTAEQFRATDGTMDGVDLMSAPMSYQLGGMSESQLMWYGSQHFIGFQACAMIAQNWLVSKACTVPAKDAIRKGWEVTANDGTEVDPEVMKEIQKYDKKYNINKNLVELVKFGRVFGIRIAMFVVTSADKDYYSKPFNLDGITKGSYKGISQIDPYWITPELSGDSVTDPSAINFYEPTFWMISGMRVHRSHLIIVRGDEVADILKPTYLYGGISVPQKIYERVYASERVANEAPQLALTKRTNIFKVNMEDATARPDDFENRLQRAAYYKDNYAIMAIDKEEEDVVQIDTALSDLDVTIMTQYQLVAAVANVPATKLLGTSPKGFGASGEYEEANYREELESIQTFDLVPLLDRHYEILLRSEICPKFGIKPFDVEVVFNPLDSLTEMEQAEIDDKRADTRTKYVNIGAIDGGDVHELLVADKDSGFNGLSLTDDLEDLNDDEQTNEE